MNKKVFLIFFACLCAFSQSVFAQYDEKVDAMLKDMTLEEKVGQMAQVTVDLFFDKKTHLLKDSMINEAFIKYKVGSILNTWDNVAHSKEEWAKLVKLLQDSASSSGLRIPLIYGVDAIHGVTYTDGATLFPQEIAMAATFNRKLVRKSAEICAYETRAGSLPWNFSPVLDLGIDVRWARLWETFGEDPFLASAMGVEMVKGYQGNDPAAIDKYHVAACAKHFLGYSVPVSGKDRTNANIPENVLREYHLPSFQAAVEAGLASIMINSGLINGESVHASHRIITDLLKNELGFNGVVVSDWNDIEKLYVRDRIASSQKDAVRLAVNAGIDMSMIPYDFRFCDYLIELVKEGSVPVERIDDAVRRILKLKFKLGLFEHPYYDVVQYPDFGSKSNTETAYNAASEAITLLKNKGDILPLKKDAHILVCGPNANTMRALNGGWSYSWLGNKTESFTGKYNTILEAIQNRIGSGKVDYIAGVEYVESGRYWEEMETGIKAAVDKAEKADCIILCLGENSYCEKPGDLQDMYLSDSQTKLAQALCSTGKPVILVLNEGRPRIISKFEDKTAAVLMTFLPGNFGGDAIADVIFGKINPSGKLPFNYPRYPQSLVNYWHKYSEEQVRSQGMYIYESDYSPQYEFGFGMSYTTFGYSNLTFSKDKLDSSEKLIVKVDVTNTGKIKGKESVLLYLSDLYASLAPDMKRLKGFEKIELEPGETKTVEFTLTNKEMSFVNINNKTVAEPGPFKVTIGSLSKIFELTSPACTSKQTGSFAKVDGNRFVVNGLPYQYIGANFWYGAMLGSTGTGGDRARLVRELDFMKSNGIDNLRILIGSDGERGVPTKVEPTLQVKPGIYNDTIFDGLDFLLSEMGKRKMYAVLFFTNSWEWSGGYGQYLNWAGKGRNPIPNIDGWPEYIEYVKQYAGCEECHKMLKEHIYNVMSRTNRYTNLKYTEDPAIFAWEIGNEPRSFSDENKPAFVDWLRDISAYIKSLDKNHMVTIGTEGKHGCEEDIKLFEKTHSDPNIDYLTMHIWPKNWSWLDIKNIPGTLKLCIDSTNNYINEHLAVAEKLNKPLVLEEFGFPRDHHLYTLTDPTKCRDSYYAATFDRIVKAKNEKTALAGCNIWSWGGFARPNPSHVFWAKGDDYLGDPAQEEQGLNSVFDTDSTVSLIRKFAAELSGKPLMADMYANEKTRNLFNNLRKQLGKGIMIGHQDDPAYGHSWYCKPGRSDVYETAGDYPSVVGWELGHLEIGAEHNLDSVYFKDMKRLMREVYDRGSINTLSWHPDNICTGNSAWDCNQDTVVRSLIPGGINHQKYIVWLDRLADFFNDLKDENGQPFPVIFRIFHENTGSWFWWGAKQCKPEEYKSLYRFTESYLRDKRNVHNIIWAYSPADVKKESEYFERFPGNEWVDVIGFDAYLFLDKQGSVDFYKTQMKNNLEIITAYANKYDKIPALTETGLESIKEPKYYTNILLPVIKPFDISYVLFWRNSFSANNQKHFYVPFAGHPAVGDFKDFTSKKVILMSKDIHNMYVNSKSVK
jgi:beta-glucosidase-like glycosyl hydrolase